MKRTMIYLPEQTHQGLRKMAFEANTSMADLIRKAVDVVYGDDIGDIRIMGEEIANYQIYPELAITLDELRRRKK
ncbi:MAG: hypothetical protein QGI92_00950 [Dehalococcoidales bacterium]|nr:hypothetical protein [Dehalococcoidales bacterium]MDP7110192.1 hypothetical protein [Dehalococcoidales bacterium]MDP7310226.1 hypothetical protein [Dehalococcoidales bacterium]MDP7409218.1 hypothetical protein [Dehalococcoidales bacterium]MDP7675552.1 hypothetical protein [Dehalococcoidales bacterium]